MVTEKIAVLLSSYNGERFLQQQIDSILNQKTDCEVTLFIRDDGSSDGTRDILKKISMIDSRVKCSFEENVGLNRSFFKLLSMAALLPKEFKYFALSDQDDVWDDNKLQVAVTAIRKEEANMPILYGCASRPVSETLEELPVKRTQNREITFYNSIIQNFIAGHTHVMNRALLNLISDVDASNLHGHDSLIINVALLYGKLIYDRTPHVSYRQHSRNELGTSNSSKLSWVIRRLKRINDGESKQYARQIEYIAEKYKNGMTDEQKSEIEKMLTSRKSFVGRAKYLAHKRVYRQETFDDMAFCVLYLFGGYNTNH